MARLGEYATVRLGQKTLLNDFFYVDEGKIRQYGIEEQFLHPIFRWTTSTAASTSKSGYPVHGCLSAGRARTTCGGRVRASTSTGASVRQ